MRSVGSGRTGRKLFCFGASPRIALSLVDHSREGEEPCDVVVTDSGYRDNPDFIRGLEERNVAYVCGVGRESTFGVRLSEEVKVA